MAVAGAVRSAGSWNRSRLLPWLRSRAELTGWPGAAVPASANGPALPAGARLPPRCPQGAGVHTSAARWAGHNKWSKVKHIKGPKDAEKSTMFAKFAAMIRYAVKEGGSNPEGNTQLANLIEQCRAKNMPKMSIEAAIKGAEKGKATSYCLYEARGPGGSFLLIELLTDNNTRSHQELKSIMNKNGGLLSDGARHCFERKGVVTVNGLDKDNCEIELEQALELAIEAGAEDVQHSVDEEDKVILKFISDLASLREVRERLSAMGLLTLSAGPEFIATRIVQLADADLETAFKLIQVLNSNNSVVRVYDNIESQS
uniref:Translational activator of cytochrome c oxidase 1 n=2 Tax=Callorhinchus milii TaxID=7868 RepID=V9L6D0_CALMI|eukprot:gi/632987468/ref/XP_007882577.1/ PREDICTED: translational activator of cytochrome c oxidase 1 [Callorhinchus milii]